MSDAEAIASRLTPAQKRALLWLPGDGSASCGPTPRGARVACRRIKKLVNWNSVTWGQRIMFETVTLTPLGARVRAALLAEAASDE